MSNVYQFPLMNLRQEIRDGKISDGTRELIRKALVDLNERHPNSWDKTFCEDMLTYSRPLSAKQSEHLERVLEDILSRTEHPSFTPKLGF